MPAHSQLSCAGMLPCGGGLPIVSLPDGVDPGSANDDQQIQVTAKGVQPGHGRTEARGHHQPHGLPSGPHLREDGQGSEVPPHSGKPEEPGPPPRDHPAEQRRRAQSSAGLRSQPAVPPPALLTKRTCKTWLRVNNHRAVDVWTPRVQELRGRLWRRGPSPGRAGVSAKPEEGPQGRALPSGGFCCPTAVGSPRVGWRPPLSCPSGAPGPRAPHTASSLLVRSRRRLAPLGAVPSDAMVSKPATEGA